MYSSLLQFIKQSLKDYGWHVDEDKFQDNTPEGKVTFANVIATLDPKATRRLVLACHYDSKFYKDKEFLGATDSAVPCAQMIDLARVMTPILKSKCKVSTE